MGHSFSPMSRQGTRTSNAGRKKISPETAFGIVVRERRKELGLLQWDIEGDTEVNQPYISKLERGLVQPCLRTILHLEEALKFAPGELLKRVRAVLQQKGSDTSPEP